MEGIEKLRKMLTLNKEAEVHIDSLMEDNDLRLNFTREDFEKMIAPSLQEFNTTLIQAIARSRLQHQQIDVVELVGEATRIPIINQIIKDAFRQKELSRTLNSQDCVARGCALQAAYLSQAF